MSPKVKLALSRIEQRTSFSQRCTLCRETTGVGGDR
jgi:hypothetical protein